MCDWVFCKCRYTGQSKRTKQRRKAAELAKMPWFSTQTDSSGSRTATMPDDSAVQGSSSSEHGLVADLDSRDFEAIDQAPFNIDVTNPPNVETLRNIDSFAPVIVSNLEPADLDANSFERDFFKTAVKLGLGRTAINNFLSVFRKHNIGNFPRDARSCLGSLRRVEVIKMHPGSYYHFGLENSLKQVLKFCILEDESVSVQINIDGLPLRKSSYSCFWPILGKVIEPVMSPVFPIGIFFSNAKPSKPTDVAQFLSYVLHDIKVAVDKGVVIDCERFSFRIHSIVCDAPARQFLKCIKPHTGYHSCERCIVKGFHVKGKGIRFTQIDCPDRTNDTFRCKQDMFHHVGEVDSPFCSIQIDLVKDFPLDYMHLVLLGVVRRFLRLWLGISKIKKSGFKCLKPEMVSKMNRRHMDASFTVPAEFQRRPRSFLFASLFKANELRSFLCYTSPLVLLKVFEDRKAPLYSHFMLLVVSIRLLLSPSQLQENIEFSRKCLKTFVLHVAKYYGSDHMVYNVHSLVHLPDDFERFGNLDKISSFPFESYLGSLKSHVKKSGKELEQVVKRLHENSNFDDTVIGFNSENVKLKGCHFDGPLGLYETVDDDVVQYSEVVFEGQTFTIKEKNNVVFWNNCFGKIFNILKVKSHVVFLVKIFTNTKDVFDYPCSSSAIGISLVSKTLKSNLINVHIREVTKCWMINYDEKPYNYIVKCLHHC